MCEHKLTNKEIDNAIQYLYDLEYEYRQCHNFWIEDIAYTCNECNDQWLKLGELLCCPKCCLACQHKISHKYE